MPSISMSCVKVLPELLKFFETKGRAGKQGTIRPLTIKKGTTNIWINDQPVQAPVVMYKAPRLKVGDICSVYWKQRSTPKDSWFCSECGKTVVPAKVWCHLPPLKLQTHYAKTPFNKLMGKVRIDKVTKIKIMTQGIEFHKLVEGQSTYKVTFKKWTELEKLANLDGFKTWLDFADYFWKYDLSKEPMFAWYRWSYV